TNPRQDGESSEKVAAFSSSILKLFSHPGLPWVSGSGADSKVHQEEMEDAYIYMDDGPSEEQGK
ncbi:hypothetical protein Taro_025911, partial [Colocasia esculenta]|nr:hypothetical protein [Colocasia esculenta]